MKRYIGLLLPVLVTLAGLAVLFYLPARGTTTRTGSGVRPGQSDRGQHPAR